MTALFGNPTNIPNPDDYWLFAEKTFRIFLSLIAFTCTIKMSSIFFQAVGRPLRAIIASVIRDIVCFIPLILTLPRFFGIEGILFAAPAADSIAMLVTVILTATYMKTLKEEPLSGGGRTYGESSAQKLDHSSADRSCLDVKRQHGGSKPLPQETAASDL